MIKFSAVLFAVFFCLVNTPVYSQTIVPNTTFFPDLKKEERDRCVAQAEIYGSIAVMRDSKISAETAIQKLIVEKKAKPEVAVIVVNAVYNYNAPPERIVGQILGECITSLSYEKLIKRSKFI